MCESGESNNVAVVSTSVDDSMPDQQSHIQELEGKIAQMEVEKQQAIEGFDVQRAKMKELFLQNEGERKRLQSDLEDARRQLAVTDLKIKDIEDQKRKCLEDISSMEHLLNETVEESSASRSQLEIELKQLQALNERLESELVDCRKIAGTSVEDRHIERDKSEPQPMQILTQATKTFARKVLSEFGADSSSSTTKDSLEDSMRKAQEDAEVLRSLVVPLEEEIVALKEKLREAHEELQKYSGQGSNAGGVQGKKKSDSDLLDSNSFLMSPTLPTNSQPSPQDAGPDKDLEHFLGGGITSPSGSSNTCNMCRNYETGLQKAQQKIKELEKSLDQAERNVQRSKDDLTREHAFRQEMEVKWNDKKEQHKIQVNDLKKKVTAAERILQDLQQSFTQIYQVMTEQLSRLEHDRVAIKTEIDKLQSENDRLVGKNIEHSENLQNQVINLPDNVEELQELLLRRHEDLIAAKVCAETQQGEADLLREELQLQQVQNAQVLEENQQLKVLFSKSELDHQRIHNLQAAEKQALEQVEELKGKLEKAMQDQVQLEETVRQQQGRIYSLQYDLDVSEQVQKDFVRLSQSLQVQLEGFRQPDTQVRWQHEEDVDECPSCHMSFGPSNSRKLHCRHCGRIFCNGCLSHKVPSGPHQRLSRVCDVCHTLLVPNTAPYFSNEPPSTPD